MKHKLYFLLAGFLMVCSWGAGAQIITTIAGGDSLGLGDGGPAIDCELKEPYSTALDAEGDLYIADALDNRIRKVNTLGIITTIAGTGNPGFSGDDSAATNAMLDEPVGVAVDGSGNIYISDDFNSRIRMVNTAGIITTVAGTNTYGYSGDGGPATGAELYDPHGIAVDVSGNVYICDELNDCLRKIDLGGIITTIAGTGSPGYSGDGGQATAANLHQPYGVALDAFGNIFISDLSDHIRKINPMGIISTIAGAGTDGTYGYNGDGIIATTAKLNQPLGVAVDGDGNIYIADVNDFRIRKVSTIGIITTIAGDGTSGFSGDGGIATDAAIGEPTGITTDSKGSLYITDFRNFRIRYVANTVSVKYLNNAENIINCYPNPSIGIFTIGINSNTNEKVSISILNSIGEKVKEMYVYTNTFQNIKLEEPPGIYFLSATSSSGIGYKKIIITK